MSRSPASSSPSPKPRTRRSTRQRKLKQTVERNAQGQRTRTRRRQPAASLALPPPKNGVGYDGAELAELTDKLVELFRCYPGADPHWRGTARKLRRSLDRASAIFRRPLSVADTAPSRS